MWELSEQDSYVGNFSGLTIKKYQIFSKYFAIFL